MKKETEGLIIAAQDQALRSITIKTNIGNTSNEKNANCVKQWKRQSIVLGQRCKIAH